MAEAGEVPALEAWEKVIITGSNGTNFLNSVHGPDYEGDDRPWPSNHPDMTCQLCHGGGADYTFAQHGRSP